MSKKMLLTIFASILVLAAIVLGITIHANNNKNLATGESIIITVAPGMTNADIATMLQNKKLINSPVFFRLQSKFARMERSLQAGEYEIMSGMSNWEIIDLFSKGQVRHKTLTIPEGYTIEQIAKKIEESGLGSAEEFKKAAKDYAPYSYMETDNINVIFKAEGFAYPSTYYLSPGSSEKEILAIMVKEFDTQLTEDMRQKAKDKNISIRDLVNLASLVEKEAVFPEERPIIAGVFLKRLQIKMPLQSDTTIQYILGVQKKEISIADTKIDSPYNTYLYAELPPGPIASPSISTINAVLEPKQTNYLYFVADLEGHHHFTETYQDHLKEIEKIHGPQ
ncbi:MAG: endolytic transglycosylase MltG [Acholeplasmataceae bacterium]|nr:endolytic transglycosylase MltG [Acholeplasmataceae bacterium]